MTPWSMFVELRTEVVAWSSSVGNKTLRHVRRAADGSSLDIRVQLRSP